MTDAMSFPGDDALPLPEAWRQAAGSLDAQQVTRLLLDILKTLGAWHRHGRIHGSLSLADVLRDDDGNAWILPPAATSDVPLPEQAGFAGIECYCGDQMALDSRTDVYAVCAVGWSLLTGQRPPCALTRAVADPDGLAGLAQAQALARPDNQALGDILLQGLGLFPEQRHASVAALAPLLRATLAHVPEEPATDALPAPVFEALPAVAEPVMPVPPAALVPQDDRIDRIDTAERAERADKTEDGRVPLPWVAAVVLALLAGLGLYWWQDGEPQPPAAQVAQVGNTGAAPEQESPAPVLPTTPLAQDPAPGQPQGAAGGTARQAGADAAEPQVAPALADNASASAPPFLPDAAAGEPDDLASLFHETPATLPGAAGDRPATEAPGTTETAALPSAAADEAGPDAEDDVASGSGAAAQAVDDAGAAAPGAQAPPAAAAVTVNLSIAPWADVYVDGVKQGVSPPLRTLSLKPGTYQVELRNGHDAPKRLQIQVQAGRQTSIAYRFGSP